MNFLGGPEFLGGPKGSKGPRKRGFSYKKWVIVLAIIVSILGLELLLLFKAILALGISSIVVKFY